MDNTTTIETIKQKIGKPSYKTLSLVAIAIVISGGLMVVGAKINAAMNPVRPPANEQCVNANAKAQEALKVFSVQLQEALVGKDAPVADLSAVKAASLDCLSKQNVYSFTVEGK